MASTKDIPSTVKEMVDLLPTEVAIFLSFFGSQFLVISKFLFFFSNVVWLYFFQFCFYILSNFRWIFPPVPHLIFCWQVFQTSARKALKSLGLSLLCVTLGVFLLANVPWFLLPVGWLFLGTSITGVRQTNHQNWNSHNHLSVVFSSNYFSFFSLFH